MKKKYIIMPLIICIAALTACGEKTSEHEETAELTGRYLRQDKGSSLIIDESNTPIVMSNYTGDENIFDNLENGDEIKITFSSIRETYPAGTDIYSCELISKGDISDIDETVITSLEDLGWIFS